MEQALRWVEEIQQFRCGVLSGYPQMEVVTIFSECDLPEAGSPEEQLYPYTGASECYYLDGRLVLTFLPVKIVDGNPVSEVIYEEHQH